MDKIYTDSEIRRQKMKKKKIAKTRQTMYKIQTDNKQAMNKETKHG